MTVTVKMAKDEKQNSEKTKALETAILQIEKQFGKGSIIKLGTKGVDEIPSIPTGALTVDIALGLGGIPRGRITEIYGPESSGKTSLALSTIAQAQKAGGVAAFVDAEHALDPAYAELLGVDVANLYVSQPDSGEQALEITESLVRSGAVDIIVVDSVAALVPKGEIDGDMGDAHMGMQARLMSQAMRKLTSIISKSKTCLIFINQMRMKIGQMFGNPETTTGGNALKFYASVRIDIRKIETLTKASEPYGTTARVKVVKNKMAPPFKKAEFDLIFGEGISQGGCIIELGVEDGIIEKSGTWYSYGAEKLGQGKENVKNYLTEHPDISIEIENKIRLKHNLKTIKASEIKGKAAPDEEKTVEKETKKSKSSAKASDAEEQMELSPEIYKSEQKKNEEN
jgi:recombination protein RecA